MSYDWIIDGGYLPRPILRVGIRKQLAQRSAEITAPSRGGAYEKKMKFVADLREMPIAIDTDAANSQHYEVRPGVLEHYLGPRLKYSCGLYPEASTTLAEAEEAMLESYVEKADIKDGMSVLDMGCGWGSVSIYLAQKFPTSMITALSNSKTQAEFIKRQAEGLGLENIAIVLANVIDHEFIASSFDRIVAIESFEHMKNYQELLKKLSGALKVSGKLFVQTFSHKDSPYHFELDDGWMSKYFFTGGTMPSADMFLYFQDDLRVKQQWWVSGNNYARTCEDWLKNWLCDMLQKWYYRWQVFFMACAELFAYENGDTWGISHYLFEK
ncbi:cyclopropane-fatty-acyl-phospholipid synthase-like protein [Aspergillus steynii IBT 23096]|uniref:Cyclopropane-fatty-acyl-phospholipid synthase-like protein n=1 Tax=Aspergillus steynii IBT 23096 TaxID=1392250 RepID=A0A2I2G433_9EURO|nr:cyclopropane-fatty-acyl-phospholipid synthase-like protein [Aspergillus steynii IBT 23096]PLB47628.1 cyclopropane-fatty-acyl-phospholipid synthase-like protein [Aspergillus steynii IBT 23096]